MAFFEKLIAGLARKGAERFIKELQKDKAFQRDLKEFADKCLADK